MYRTLWNNYQFDIANIRMDIKLKASSNMILQRSYGFLGFSVTVQIERSVSDIVLIYIITFPAESKECNNNKNAFKSYDILTWKVRLI